MLFRFERDVVCSFFLFFEESFGPPTHVDSSGTLPLVCQPPASDFRIPWPLVNRGHDVKAPLGFQEIVDDSRDVGQRRRTWCNVSGEVSSTFVTLHYLMAL